MKLINLFVIGFVGFIIGFLFGEIETCKISNNNYSFDYGCKVRK